MLKVRNLAISLALCTFSLSSFALSHKCEVLVRNKSKKLIQKKVELTHLRSVDSFSGKYFKIVKGKEEKALSFNSKLSFRACHVYYHLSKAREYFSSHFDLPHLNKPRALVIRVEMELGYNDSSHFLHENLGKFYNNALTIPPSGVSRLDIVKPWYYEIWFAPKKKVKIKSAFARASEVASSWPVLNQMIFGIFQQQATQFGSYVLQGNTVTALEGEYYFKSLLFSIGVTALVPNIMKWSSKLFKKTIFLDSLMIPEVIYHEFTHFALSPHISIDKHSALGEGIANFYAALIGKTDSILGRSRKYAKGLIKIEAKKTKKYEYYMEDSKYAQLDFTFKFLYGIKSEMGQIKSEQLVFKAASSLEDKFSIKENFLPALFNSIESTEPSQKYQLIKVMDQFGF
jgi:hypothetical protein